MRKNILFLIIICAALTGHSQSWAPIGAKWTYGVAYAAAPGQEFREWICTRDTLLNGQLCQLIVRQGADVATDITDSLITYQDSNIVYWFNAGQFRVLYDFNKNAGESWTIYFDTCEVTVTVDSTSTININGNTLKVQHLAPSPFGYVNTKVIEGIGNTNQPIPDFHILCGIGVIDMNYYSGLRCYEDSLLGYYNFNISPTCNYISTGILAEMEQSNEVIVYPNPAADFLTITAKPADIFIIYNAFGEVIFDMDIQFCLAQKDTNGNILSEPGIDRINFVDKGWNNPNQYTTQSSMKNFLDSVIKPQSIWDVRKYMNVWVTDKSNLLTYGGVSSVPPLSGLPDIVAGATDQTDGIWCYAGVVGSSQLFPTAAMLYLILMEERLPMR